MIQFINKVEMCEAYHVHALPYPKKHEVVFIDYAPFIPLPTVDFSPMECTDSIEDGQRVYTIEVTAKLRNRITLPDKQLAFRLTNIYGEQYLLGVPDCCPPYPLVTQSDKAGARPSDTGFCDFRIQLKSIFPLMKIKV